MLDYARWRKRLIRVGSTLGLYRPKQRAFYRDVWNDAALTDYDAKVSVIGSAAEEDLNATAAETIARLEATVGIRSDDMVLEIGCGVGRVGLVLADRCRWWTGADVSDNMLRFAAQRLAGKQNITLQRVDGYGLAAIQPGSLDLVYSTVVFMHLDEWDRFAYVRDGFQVLRPGGRMYVDNFNLCSDEGWAFFLKNMTEYAPAQRPPNISKSSTVQELRTYFERAGFSDIQHAEDGLWVSVWGTRG